MGKNAHTYKYPVARYVDWFFLIFVFGEGISTLISLAVGERIQAIANATAGATAGVAWCCYRLHYLDSMKASFILVWTAWAGIVFHVIHNGFQADIAFLMCIPLVMALLFPKRLFWYHFLLQSGLNVLLVAYGYVSGYQGILHDPNSMGSLIMVYLFSSAIALAYIYAITDHIEKIEQAKERNELLLKELQHRVKNNLNRLVSLIHFEAKPLTSKERLPLEALAQKVEMMRIAHRMLEINKNPARISVCRYFELIKKYWSDGVSEKKASIELQCQKVSVDLETVISMGMIVNELVYNTIKHSQAQPIRIGMEITHAKGKISLRYSEYSGVHDLSDDAKKSGGGLDIVLLLVRQHKGEIEQNGWHYRIVLPLKEDT